MLSNFGESGEMRSATGTNTYLKVATPKACPRPRTKPPAQFCQGLGFCALTDVTGGGRKMSRVSATPSVNPRDSGRDAEATDTATTPAITVRGIVHVQCACP